MTLIQDLIYAARSLRKAPGLVAVVVLTLALGIGVNTTVFNVLNLMLLAPPTAVEPDRLVRIEPGTATRSRIPIIATWPAAPRLPAWRSPPERA